MKKLLLAVGLTFGLFSLSHAGGLIGGGAFRTFMSASGTVVIGGGELNAVICSTPGVAVAANGAQWLQFFDTAPLNGQTGVFTLGNIALTSITSTNTITPQLVWPSSMSIVAQNLTIPGYDFSQWGGLHFNNALFFFMNTPLPAGGCSIIWKREERE